MAVMIMSGDWAMAAWKFDTSPGTSPSVGAKIIWQSAPTNSQASSIPFLTDWKKALALPAWTVKMMLSCSSEPAVVVPGEAVVSGPAVVPAPPIVVVSSLGTVVAQESCM
jgi:hypothetical protein